ncbi:MAG: hypothetical protein PHX27_03235 [Candidatus ainarchaeum sp.]|nr:hypothetical protein [Candidatus ainarchaeum sp.]
MDDLKTNFVYSIILIIFALTTGYFFYMAGIKFQNFLTINIFELLDLMLTFNFVLFIIFASITIAIIELIIKKFNPKIAIIISTICFLISAILIGFFFGLIEFIIPTFFGIIGIFFATITQANKEKEYKTMPILRSGISSGGKIVLFIGLGMLLFTLMITIQNQEFYEADFVKEFQNITIGEQKSIQYQIQEPLINSIIQTQKQTINAIKKINGFNELENKNDTDVLTFISGFKNFEITINSEEYKKTLNEQYTIQQEEQDISQQILESIPLIKSLSKYAWLIYSILSFLLIMGIGNIIIKNLSGIIYSIIEAYTNNKPIEKDIY